MKYATNTPKILNIRCLAAKQPKKKKKRPILKTSNALIESR